MAHGFTTLEAATTPRLQSRGGFPRGVARVRIGGDGRDLPQQVDALLHVADEVAAGHLVVVEHVGERVTAPPTRRCGA